MLRVPDCDPGKVLVTLTGAYVVASLGATIANRNFWPIASNNMFNAKFGDRVSRFAVEFHLSDGTVVTCGPANCLPTQFFRAGAMFANIFMAADEQPKRVLCQRIETRLRRNRWKPFDEVRAPAHLPNIPLGRMDILVETTVRGMPEEKEVVYTYVPSISR
ncbi:hypothetical protein [Paenarthrobacter aurescens]|uniref:hypothetical protein n=1 Tax=Paenarthrobacter aurescens TaxID=43663 RepID=UPI0021BEBCB3|nr:hypothetical protein [Paenarthrobacter aurescens]MCT9869695.1 hypothetical protein [Paenarthrobacter aurescens]